MSSPQVPTSVVRYILSTERRRHVELLALVVSSIALSLVPVHLLRLFVDEVIPERQIGRLWWLSAGLIGAALVRVAVDYRKSVVGEWLRQAVIGRLRAELTAHILRLPPSFFASHPVGDLMNRVQNETGRLGMSVGWIFVDPLVEGTTALLYSAYLVAMDVRLFLLALAMLPIAIVVAPRINAKLADASRVFTQRMGTYGARLQESLANAGEIQTHGTWSLEEARTDHAQRRVVDAWMRVTRLTSWLGALSDASRGIGPVLVYAVGAWLAVSGDLPVGRLIAFAGLLSGLYGAIDKLLRYPPQLRVASDRYAELRALLVEPAWFVDGPGRATDAGDDDAKAPDLALDGVTFAHETGRAIVDELSLDVRAGEHVAIVGPSGCGKSTALGLLTGRLAPSRGVVRVGASPLVSLTQAERVASLGIANQQAVVFAGSLRENLLYAMLRERAGDPASPLDWIDRGVASERVSDEALLDVCADVGLASDLVDFGLAATLERASAAPFEPVRSTLAAPDPPAPWDDSRSLRDNLLPAGWDAGDPDSDAAALARLRALLEADGLSYRVRRLALDRDLGERGSRLSGGQRQKVALARVLLASPRALLLDEVTASLDPESARRVIATVRERHRGRAVIAVTHDLRAARAFDRVIVMEAGRVVEHGSADELLAQDGLFRRLWAQQEASAA